MSESETCPECKRPQGTTAGCAVCAGRNLLDSLVEEGFAPSRDEAAHMLVDMGEIDSSTHADLLSQEERERIYGE